MKRFDENTYHLIGWILFILCSIFYILSSVLAGNIISAIGGVLFFLGCVAFLIPLIRKEKK